MNDLNKFILLEQTASKLRTIRTRTWLMLAAVALGFIALLFWAGMALLTWLWAEAPAMSEAGKRLAGDTLSQFEQAAPGLKKEVEQWAPGVKQQLDRWLPGESETLPANDVSGVDIGPVPRFPGLVRTYFARDAKTIEARYSGRASFEAVLKYYTQGFATAGYTQEVITATSEAEQHRFRRAEMSVDLSLMRRPDGRVELRLKTQEGR